MKILMFGWEFPPFNSGGLGVACLGLTKALSSQDVQITFVLPKKIKVKSNFVKFRFADTRKVKHPIEYTSGYITSSSFVELMKKHPGIYGPTLFDEVLQYAKLARKIAEEEDYDIIHVHDWLCIPAGIEAKKVSGKPLVVHIHATEFDRSGDKINQDIYEIEKMGMQEADKIVAVSNYTKNIILQKYGIDPNKIEVVWNGIEEDSFGGKDLELLQEIRNQGCKLVLFVGRLTMQKGPDYFLQAAKKVIEYDPNVVFLISGAGDMQNQIIRQTSELGISDKVLFSGFLRGSELEAVYKAADLFVMPSVSEPFGITALESASYGTPIIVSKQSGVSEALTNVLKVDFWDTDEMANKMLSVLAHTSLHDCMSDNGKQEVKKLNWNAAASKCVVMYKKLLHLS